MIERRMILSGAECDPLSLSFTAEAQQVEEVYRVTSVGNVLE